MSWTGIGIPIVTTPGAPLADQSGIYPRPLLDLDTYARMMQLDPLRLASGYSNVRPVGTCSDIWFEFDYQAGDKVSRQQLRMEIARAEADIAHILGFWPAAVWVINEQQEISRYFRREQQWRAVRTLNVRARWGYVLDAGAPIFAPISTEIINRQDDLDVDGDGFDEWAHFTIDPAPANFQTNHVHAYYKEWDPGDTGNVRPDPSSSGADPAWELRPIRCVAAGSALEVYIPIWLLFNPALRQGMAMEAIEADLADNYVDTVSFYTESKDTDYQARLTWETSDCLDADCDTETESACVRVRNSRPGILNVPVGLATGHITRPRLLTLWYRAGYADSLDDFWAQQIATLATTRLNRPLCDCGAVADRVRSLQDDMVRSGTEGGFQVPQNDLDCPLGTRRGELLVWRQLQSYRLGRGILPS